MSSNFYRQKTLQFILGDLRDSFPLKLYSYGGSYNSVTLINAFVNSNGADQPALQYSLINTVVDRCMHIIIQLVSISRTNLISLPTVAASRPVFVGNIKPSSLTFGLIYDCSTRRSKTCPLCC